VIEAWNTKDPRNVIALYAPNGVRHQYALPEAHLEGPDAIGQMVTALMHSTPDFVLSEIGSISQGNHEALEWRWDGTVQNDLGDLPGRGQEIHLCGTSIFELVDDRVVLESVYWDTATLLAGAGLLTAA
jgi:predicted ester cyclase